MWQGLRVFPLFVFLPDIGCQFDYSIIVVTFLLNLFIYFPYQPQFPLPSLFLSPPPSPSVPPPPQNASSVSSERGKLPMGVNKVQHIKSR